jgi:hypothetical protein
LIGVGLQEALEAAVAQPRRAALRADDPGRHRLADAERIPHGQSHVAHAHLIGISQREHRQIVPFNLEHGQIAARIVAYELCVVTTIVRHFDSDLFGAVDHVMIRQQISVLRNDHAGTEAALNLLARRLRLSVAVAEEFTEERIV